VLAIVVDPVAFTRNVLGPRLVDRPEQRPVVVSHDDAGYPDKVERSGV
jgi:hypothetical protein